ncbi:hypothetical protein B0T22DRAFT_55505 [Podospora appendiculata]|uniref:DUF7905 domain-containing protein n=1 Tax=Podospora appendiculata TaxID=314037 RepID=A0AAE0XIG8_9PEZI|nr:hypothetical protein B0T22DRAFT_55505 [Podospora appendiculata]
MASPAQNPTLLYITMPLAMHGFNQMDPTNVGLRTTIDQIRHNFNVKVQPTETGSALFITAPNKTSAKEAIAVIRQVLIRKAGEKIMWQPLVLVTPPKSGPENLRAILQQKEGVPGARPTAFPSSTDANNPAGQVTVMAVKSGYKEAMSKALMNAAENLRFLPNKMRMRVRFGNLYLKEWKKGKDEYTLTDLESLLRRAGPRGTAAMDTFIGYEGIVDSLRAQLVSLAAGGLQCATLSEPVHSLVFVTKNLSRESVLEKVRTTGKIQANGKLPYRYSLGPIEAFHLEKRYRTVEIMSACPESRHDWILEVSNHISTDDSRSSAVLPFDDKRLSHNIRFSSDVVDENFPRISVNPAFVKSFGIENIVGKTSWTYLINSKYFVEVSMYRRWGQNTTLPPISGVCVSMYGDSWDNDMEFSDLSTGPRDWKDFAKQFLVSDSPKYQDPYDDFLYWVHRIQGMLDGLVKDK